MRIEQLGRLDAATSAALADLWVRAWTPTMPGIDFVARRGWFLAHLAGLIERGSVVLVGREPDGSPTGFLTLHRGTGDIDQLAVDPCHAGRGAARALMDEAKRLSPSGLTLSVNLANTRALRLYQRAGFRAAADGFGEQSGLPIRYMAWPGGR